ADRPDHAAPPDLPASPGCVEKAAPGLDDRFRLRPAAVAVTDALHADDFVLVGMELLGNDRRGFFAEDRGVVVGRRAIGHHTTSSAPRPVTSPIEAMPPRRRVDPATFIRPEA